MNVANKSGSMLLEVVAALLIASLVGAATISLLRETVRAHETAVKEEGTIESANRVLTAASLLTRDDLDARRGSARVGEFLVTIRQAQEGLYGVSVAEAQSPDRPLLTTLVFRRQ